jgi:hypothetical protein
MSQLIIEDSGWRAIMEDDRLKRARTRLSLHEIRLIVQHARAHPLYAQPCFNHEYIRSDCPDCGKLAG